MLSGDDGDDGVPRCAHGPAVLINTVRKSHSAAFDHEAKSCDKAGHTALFVAQQSYGPAGRLPPQGKPCMRCVRSSMSSARGTICMSCYEGVERCAKTRATEAPA